MRDETDDPMRDHVRHVCAVEGERGECAWPDCPSYDDHCDIAVQAAERSRPDWRADIWKRTRDAQEWDGDE